MTLQEIFFDLVDLQLNNSELMKLPIKGFPEFKNLGEFIEEQRIKVQNIEEKFE